MVSVSHCTLYTRFSVTAQQKNNHMTLTRHSLSVLLFLNPPFTDIFVKLLMFFKTYVTFANNFDTAISTIGVCRQKASFNAFLQYVAVDGAY